MLNQVVLQGRFTAHPELKHTQSGTPVCSFSLAVDRSYKKEGAPTADFINCVAWKNTAEFITQYFRKGQEVLVNGALQLRKYTDQQGAQKQITEVLVLGVNFCGPKQQENQQQSAEPVELQQMPQYQPAQAKQPEPIYTVPAPSMDILADEDLPF